MKKSIKRKGRSSQDSAVYKVPEAARVANTGQLAIRKGVRDNIIPHLRLSRTILIPKAAFHAWLDSCGGKV